MKRLLVLLLLSGLSSTAVSKELSAGKYLIKSPVNRLVTMPTAKMMSLSATDFEFRLQPDGVLLFGLEFGIFRSATIGLTYGYDNYLDYHDFKSMTLPGVILKYSLCREARWGPAVVIGADTQGWGRRLSNLNPGISDSRYLFKAPGIYMAASKNVYCRCFGTIGFHGGITYNLFETEDDSDPNFYVGLDRHLFRWFSAAVEYNAAMNDNNPDSYGENGYISALIRYQHYHGWNLEFIFIDLATDNKFTTTSFRAVRFVFPLDLHY